MIDYGYYGHTTYACFAGETDNLRYNWFKALHKEFKRRLPFMKNAVLSDFILKYTSVERYIMVRLSVIPKISIARKLVKKLQEKGS